ncbi:MAG: tetratricopeptide repeat protein [Cyclobacteriaceae bacterium]|nr:tetratricopeptide repeat protein [Cyclobacteriaceae bacterium]
MRFFLVYILIGLRLALYGQGNPQLAEQHYQNALQLHRNGNYEEALREVNRCLFLNASQIAPYLLRADIWERLQRTDQALTDVETAILLTTESRELIFRKALLCFQLQKWDDAHEAFRKVLRLQAGETNTLYYAQLPNTNATVGIITAQSDVRTMVFQHLGAISLHLHRCEEALAWFDSALSLQKDLIDVQVCRAEALAQCGNKTAAVKELQKALEVEPENARALRQLALLTNHREELLTLAIRADSLLPDSWLERANYRMNVKNYEGAELDYTRALAILRHDAEIWLNRGMAREQLGNYSGAYEDFSTALQLDEQLVAAWLHRGNVQVQLKQYKNAVEDYSAAIAIAPDYGKAYFNRGGVFLKLNEKQKACSDFHRASELGLMLPEKIKRICANSMLAD